MRWAQTKWRPMKKLCLPLFEEGEKRGEKKGNVGSPTQTLVALKKNKGKEKKLEPREESLEHINFHLSFNQMAMCIP